MHACCRVFCQLLRPDLDGVLAQQPPARGPLLDLLQAVHQLEKKAQKHFPAALGEHPQLHYCGGEPADEDCFCCLPTTPLSMHVPMHACGMCVKKPPGGTQFVHKRTSGHVSAILVVAGVEGVFVDENQSPLFLIYMEEYLRGVQSTLTEWITRGLKQVRR